MGDSPITALHTRGRYKIAIVQSRNMVSQLHYNVIVEVSPFDSLGSCITKEHTYQGFSGSNRNSHRSRSCRAGNQGSVTVL